ncbi:MAG: metal-dependent transcriptional regulator [Deltaproteobacteria bacterium]|nr:metal-dependent transcriptional regulator [Deltaproteobacteria bacterium]MBW2532108.1 metal-dependent transcriptional regulator [Deltaproteobacteria bacterium]
MKPADEVVLSHALQDYLESIHVLLKESPVARVRDIAKARSVRTGSVISALRRLRDAGLIDYRQREYVNLTPTGEEAARRIYARHQVLSRFFRDVLDMPAELAEQDACAMEHGLSDEGMDRLVRLFEFLGSCPRGEPGFLEAFHRCTMAQDEPDPAGHCTGKCHRHPGAPARDGRAAHEDSQEQGKATTMSVYDLRPGQSGTVTHVNARGSIRQRLLDMGVLPDAAVELVRVAPAGNPIWIRLDGTQIALRKAEAEAVLVK